MECCLPVLSGAGERREVAQTRSFRGSKSRNKVSVGEPAEGSLLLFRLGSRASMKVKLKPALSPTAPRLVSTIGKQGGVTESDAPPGLLSSVLPTGARGHQHSSRMNEWPSTRVFIDAGTAGPPGNSLAVLSLPKHDSNQPTRDVNALPPLLAVG
jgi:hypothetical protein